MMRMMKRGSNMSTMRSSTNDTVELGLVLDIARRVTEDIRDLEVSRDQWGSEDYADALGCVATLFDFASAQMLYNVYKDDPVTEATLPIHNAYENRRDEAIQALEDLNAFGFSYDIDDLIAYAI